MELIKIERPINDFMDNSLTKEQCDQLLEFVKESLNSEESLAKCIRESELAGFLAGYGAVTVVAIIAMLIKYIKNKYSMTATKLYDQSKELNDIYVKVDDLLKHDKMARFKHRNDRIDYESHYIIMKDKRDKKDYTLKIDYLVYSPDYFIKEVDDIINYVDKYSKDKKTDRTTLEHELMKKIDDSFDERHGFVKYYDPMMKIVSYKGEKLEKVLMFYKEYIDNIYNIIYDYNKCIDGALQGLQYMQTAYNRMLSKYNKDKEAKSIVDNVFKKLLENTTMSIDFNTRSMVILNEMIRYYTDELTKLYDLIRS